MNSTTDLGTSGYKYRSVFLKVFDVRYQGMLSATFRHN